MDDAVEDDVEDVPAPPKRVRAPSTGEQSDEDWDWKIAIARARAATSPG